MRRSLQIRSGPVRTCALLLTALLARCAAATPFYMGADVSLETFMQQKGVVFKSNGVAAPADQILYDAGANLFRLRLFVNPDTSYSATNGAIQNLSYDIALAQQIKTDAPGAKLLLDLQYSDTWADPSHQATPAAWAGQSLTQLQSAVESYTSSTLAAFSNAGVMPAIVQLGNEIQSGMLWNSGSINFNGTVAQQKSTWAAFGSLENAAIKGVRDAEAASGAAVQVAVHPGPSNSAAYFFQHLTDPSYGNVNVGSIDMMGVSYYPSASGALASLTSDMKGLINTYNKPVMVMETQAPWETTQVASDPDYPDTPAGQLQFLTDLKTAVMSLPNGDGAGVLYWYPESVQVAGYNIYDGGSTALFDNNGNALPAIAAFAVPEPSTALLAAAPLLLGIRSRRKFTETLR